MRKCAWKPFVTFECFRNADFFGRCFTQDVDDAMCEDFADMLHEFFCTDSDENCVFMDECDVCVNPWMAPEHRKWLKVSDNLLKAGVDPESVNMASEEVYAIFDRIL